MLSQDSCKSIVRATFRHSQDGHQLPKQRLYYDLTNNEKLVVDEFVIQYLYDDNYLEWLRITNQPVPDIED